MGGGNVGCIAHLTLGYPAPCPVDQSPAIPDAGLPRGRRNFGAETGSGVLEGVIGARNAHSGSHPGLPTQTLPGSVNSPKGRALAVRPWEGRKSLDRKDQEPWT